MPDKYISVEAFTASMQELYCKNCDRRKGMKNGKLKTVYAIGDAPCRSCGIDDMLDDIDAYPPADVVLRSCYDRILAENDTMREQLAAIGKKPGDSMDDVRIANAARWIEIDDYVFCPNCGTAEHTRNRNFCHNCGTYMREANT